LSKRRYLSYSALVCLIFESLMSIAHEIVAPVVV
jgi:hypothetical protein